MKSTCLIPIAIAFAMAVTTAHAATVTPFAQAEATLTDSGLKNSISNASATKYNDEVGAGITVGVRINQRHEISLSSGYVDFTGKAPVVTPGIVSVNSKVEQVPVLLNYRYRLPVDSKGRFTVFAGPSIGIVQQKTSLTSTQLGALPANLVGTSNNNDSLFAYGATVGVDAKLSKHWSAGASAQVLEVASGGKVPFYGTTTQAVDFKSATRPTFALAVGYSW